jgi:hypothetical protein
LWQRLYSRVAYRLRPCLMQTVGHSSPVLSYLLTAHYSLLTGARVAAPLFLGGLPFAPLFHATVGHSSPVLSYLLTAPYSLLTRAFSSERTARRRVKNLLAVAMSRAIWPRNSSGPLNFFSSRKRFQK